MIPALEAAELPADAVEVGWVADAWGVRGWLKIQPHSRDPQALFSSKRWFLAAGQGPSAAALPQPVLMPVTEAREHGAHVVARSLSISDRDAALALRGARVYVRRSSFPSTLEDEFYWVDLMGLTVVNREGVTLGVVTDLLATGPQTVLVLHQASEPQPVERMIPFVSQFVDAVDLAGRLIRVDWQPDY